MNVTRTARLLLATPALIAALALTGCDDSTTYAAPAPVATDRPTTAPSDHDETDHDDEEPAAPAASPDAETEAGPEAGWPQDVDNPVQGQTYGLVVLAAGDPEVLDSAAASVAEHGYEAYTAEVGCLVGAEQALDLPSDMVVSHMLFPDLADAQEFVGSYTPATGIPVVGVAEVKAYCLD